MVIFAYNCNTTYDITWPSLCVCVSLCLHPFKLAHILVAKMSTLELLSSTHDSYPLDFFLSIVTSLVISSNSLYSLLSNFLSSISEWSLVSCYFSVFKCPKFSRDHYLPHFLSHSSVLNSKRETLILETSSLLLFPNPEGLTIISIHDSIWILHNFCLNFTMMLSVLTSLWELVLYWYKKCLTFDLW